MIARFKTVATRRDDLILRQKADSGAGRSFRGQAAERGPRRMIGAGGSRGMR